MAEQGSHNIWKTTVCFPQVKNSFPCAPINLSPCESQGCINPTCQVHLTGTWDGRDTANSSQQGPLCALWPQLLPDVQTSCKHTGNTQFILQNIPSIHHCNSRASYWLKWAETRSAPGCWPNHLAVFGIILKILLLSNPEQRPLDGLRQTPLSCGITVLGTFPSVTTFLRSLPALLFAFVHQYKLFVTAASFSFSLAIFLTISSSCIFCPAGISIIPQFRHCLCHLMKNLEVARKITLRGWELGVAFLPLFL